MPSPTNQLPPYINDLTHRIIGCAFTVHNTLGNGFHESVYQKALAVELWEAGLSFVREADIPVVYKGHPVGDYFADFVVNNLIILELKALLGLDQTHGAQLVNYLKVSSKPIGLLLNFGPRRVDVIRKLGPSGSGEMGRRFEVMEGPDADKADGRK